MCMTLVFLHYCKATVEGIRSEQSSNSNFRGVSNSVHFLIWTCQLICFMLVATDRVSSSATPFLFFVFFFFNVGEGVIFVCHSAHHYFSFLQLLDKFLLGRAKCLLNLLRTEYLELSYVKQRGGAVVCRLKSVTRGFYSMVVWH